MRVERTLITSERIAQRVAELGAAICADLQALAPEPVKSDASSPRVVLVPILTGALVFVADLIRRMPLPLSLRVAAVSSYPGATTASLGARLRGELPRDLKGQHVLVVDDILDTGRTLSLILSLIREQEPASVRTCVLLRKQVEKREADVEVDYVGFDVPDEFVVGYGLDYDGLYRNLPAIAVLGRGREEHP